MRDRTIFLEPPLEEARAMWLTDLHSRLIVVCRLPQLQSERFKSALTTDGTTGRAVTFSGLPTTCIPAIENAYAAIEREFQQVKQYINGWLQYQSLWDLQMDDIHSHLSDNLAEWLQLLREVKQRRETFDTTESSRSFRHLNIDYAQIQDKVGARYDQWQRELTAQFASRLADAASHIHAELTRSRRDLEGQTVETSSTSQAVACITAVQIVQLEVRSWESQMVTLADGQRTLTRQRYPFPSDWLTVEQVEHEWTALQEALNRRVKAIDTQSEALKVKIGAEDRILAERAVDLTDRWNDAKPISGRLLPADAIATLQRFDGAFTQLSSQLEIVTRAKEALRMPIGSSADLSIITEEISGLKLVWNNLKTIWDSVTELLGQLWTSVQPRKLRQALENLLKMTKDMPSRMRQYDAFQHLQSVLQQHIRVNGLLNDLRSDAIKDRHWVQIFKDLRPNKRYSAALLTLGDVYDLQLGPSEPVIRAILTQAQGEMALEEFMSDVRNTWQEYNLDLGGCKSWGGR